MAPRRVQRSIRKAGPDRGRVTVATPRRALAAVAIYAGVACGAAGPATASANSRGHAPSSSKPRVLSVRYGRFRPVGAPRAYTALQITARAADQQIVSVAYQQIDPHGGGGGVIADSPCGLGGKHAGQTETFTLPIKLRPGRYHFRVTVGSSPCAKAGRPQTASRTLTILAP